MPEGHTIHRVARDHARQFVGHTLQVQSPQGRFSREARVLNERKLELIEAHGKHLFYHWRGDKLLHIHLGLYGKFRLHRLPVPAPQGQVRLRVIGPEQAFDLNGPTACDLISRSQYEGIRARLGPDPLRHDGSFTRVAQRISSSRAPLGTLLLNQSVIAGVGNVYRSELLYLLKIHPQRMGKDVSCEELLALWKLTCELMKIGVRYNRIIVADPKQIGKPRSRMNRSERLLIYKKARCATCDGQISSWLLAARKVYACQQCQR